MGILLKVNLPLILDFVLRGENISLDLFTGIHPVLKFELLPNSIANGFGELMFSNNIVNIVPRLDAEKVHHEWRMLAMVSFKPINILVLNFACHAIDIMVMGRRMFMVPPLLLERFVNRLATKTTTRIQVYLFLPLLG